VGDSLTPYKGRKAEPIIEAALAMYEEGIEIGDAAKELDVPARTIHRWLATNAQDRWHEAQKGRALADYEGARKRRDDARSALEDLKATLETENVKEPAERNWRLTHAREVLRAADTELNHQQWLLERLLRRIYGQEAPQQTGGLVQINIGIRRNSDTVDAQVIESDRNTSVCKSDALPEAGKESIKHAFPGRAGVGGARKEGGQEEQVADLSPTRAV
jgi:transposase